MNMTPTCSAGTPKRVLGLLLALLALFASSLALQGAYLWSVPVTVVQPDGEVLHLLATGDEYYNWVHDKDNYTIVRDPNTGVIEYARVENDKLAPSGYRVGTVKPSAVGLRPGANVFPDRQQVSLVRSRGELEPSNPAPTSGTINNLVVFIRFSDESEFTDATSLYSTQFNTSVSSMDHYFQEASYNALAISTTFYPLRPGSTVVSYRDSHPRAYYQPYNETTNPIGYETDADVATREHMLLADAVNAISLSVPVGLDLDGDSDGKVDNVCFVVYGGPDGWNDLLWPHQWSLYSQTVYINSKRVYTYNFQLQTSVGVGVLCHEMFHSLGAPDLYHYSDDGLSPVGRWDLMESDQTPPQHMSAYMKYKYGHWIASIPEIPAGETYTLNPLTSSTGQCYKIASNNSPTEFFVVEYRRKTGTFESSIPGSGLLVYRINTSVEGNADGPPDEIYAYRPGGTLVVNGTVNGANYSSDVGRTAIDDTTSPSSFLTDGSPGGLRIWDIGTAGSTISFKADVGVTFPDPGLEAAIRAAIGKPTGIITDSDLGGLTALDAGDRAISELAGIEHCVNLQLLSLDLNQISGLVPLVGLTALKTLYLWNNQISDLAPLAGLTALKRLGLEYNQISDLTPLAGLTALTVLWLDANQISDLTPLAGLTKLESLDLANNQISDIAPLAGLTALKTLYLYNSPISDLAPLAGLTALTSLHLGGNKISDLAPLAALVGLAYLDLFENKISDLAPLAGLTALTDLWLQTNQISNLVPLAGLTALETLYLAENQISDLAPLAELTALEYLYLKNNQISDLTPLAGLTALTDLSLQTNQISELAPLVLNSGMGSGDWLDVRSNYLCVDPGSGEDLPDVSLLLARGVSVWHWPQTACRPDSSAAVFRVADEGSVRADSGFYGSSFTTGAADLAEWVQVTGSVKAGDVLELDPSLGQSYRLAQTPCSDLVAGVVSTQPGVTLGAGTVGPQQALLALSGIVPVKVTNEGGPIQPGDLLVSSSTPGYAMRWAGPEPCPCALVGKALEPMTDDRGVISVLLTAH